GPMGNGSGREYLLALQEQQQALEEELKRLSHEKSDSIRIRQQKKMALDEIETEARNLGAKIRILTLMQLSQENILLYDDDGCLHFGDNPKRPHSDCLQSFRTQLLHGVPISNNNFAFNSAPSEILNIIAKEGQKLFKQLLTTHKLLDEDQNTLLILDDAVKKAHRKLEDAEKQGLIADNSIQAEKARIDGEIIFCNERRQRALDECKRLQDRQRSIHVELDDLDQPTPHPYKVLKVEVESQEWLNTVETIMQGAGGIVGSFFDRELIGGAVGGMIGKALKGVLTNKPIIKYSGEAPVVGVKKESIDGTEFYDENDKEKEIGNYSVRYRPDITRACWASVTILAEKKCVFADRIKELRKISDDTGKQITSSKNDVDLIVKSLAQWDALKKELDEKAKISHSEVLNAFRRDFEHINQQYKARNDVIMEEKRIIENIRTEIARNLDWFNILVELNDLLDFSNNNKEIFEFLQLYKSMLSSPIFGYSIQSSVYLQASTPSTNANISNPNLNISSSFFSNPQSSNAAIRDKEAVSSSLKQPSYKPQ
ncbi:MAG: hypothetical protein JST52_12070, partial [Bacteroidetes bacterium]|nr:hypothetical protein [Bacteroidota bacterium]